MSHTCTEESQTVAATSNNVEQTIQPPPGLENVIAAHEMKDDCAKPCRLAENEYKAGERVLALRSSGSWSEGTIVEVTSNKVTVMLPSGIKQIRNEMTSKLLQKIKPACLLEAQLAYQVASAELEHAQLSYAMQSQSWGMEQGFASKLAPSKAYRHSVVSDGGCDTASTASHGCSSAESSDDCVEQTTLMMRNIPNSLTRSQVLQLLDNAGFRGHYNLFYLPVDLKHEAGLGYAFINFVNNDSARAFSAYFNGFNAWNVKSDKVCMVAVGQGMQGLDEYVQKYRDFPAMHESVPDEFRPVLFRNGMRVPFPPPTKQLKAPRIFSRRH